jgi:AraC family transcriptional regulator, regulatory protein of adaptative response / DNA-3-methyladenine glycosylase II
MNKTDLAHYNAYLARDPRFDGVFFLGVTSTGIYCRPICPAKTVKQANIRFYDTQHAAEKAGFRPCLRCRPELAPGNAPVDDAQRIAHLIASRIEEGLIEGDAKLEDIASQFDLSSRQIRRIIQKEMGVSPIELMQTRRLLLAKQLLTETSLPMTEIAFASGFSSLRRFNDAFRRNYRMPPTRLRKEASNNRTASISEDTSIVQLSYRAPYDWKGILDFLRTRMIKEIEWVTNDEYLRTVRMGKHKGWLRVRNNPQKHALTIEFTHTLTPVLPALLGRLKDLFDLSARPDLISSLLKKDKILKDIVKNNAGLRVPGAFDGFELAIRAILGQQITVKAATTLSCRFAEAFGEKIITPIPKLSRLSPLPEKIAKASVDDIAKLGIVSARAKAIIALAKTCRAGMLNLESSSHPEKVIEQLVALPGIGLWTAHYIAMRALRWPDAFPKGDIAILNNLGNITAKEADKMSQKWRPWRSYAVLYIWRKKA